MKPNELSPFRKILMNMDDKLQQSCDFLQSIDSKITSGHASQVAEKEVANRIFSKREAMEYLGIKESTYYRWINEEKLKPRGVPKRDYYYESDLLLLKFRRRYRERG